MSPEDLEQLRRRLYDAYVAGYAACIRQIAPEDKKRIEAGFAVWWNRWCMTNGVWS